MRSALYRRSFLLLLALGALGPLPAQDLDCNVFAAFANARGEDKTALLGDIVISCQSASPLDPPPISEVVVNIDVLLPVPVANRNVSSSVDAVLVTNENNCETPSSSNNSYGCGGNYPDPRYASKSGSRELRWQAVRVPFPGALNPQSGANNPPTTVLRITSIRADLSVLGPPSTGVMPIDVILVVSPPAALGVSTQALTTTFRRQGLTSSVDKTASGMACEDSGTGPHSAALVSFAEGFSSAFRPKGSPNYSPADSLTESGYFAPGAPTGGAAEAPTQVGLLFSKVPQGVTLSAPRTLQSNGLTMTVNGRACGSGGTETVTIDSSGAGSLIYDYCGGDPSSKESAEVPITASWSGGSTGVGAAKVEVTLAPLSSGIPEFRRPGSSKTFLTLSECTPPPPPPAEEKVYLTKMSVYQDGHWLQDRNGNGLLDTEVETSFGFGGAMPISGDWDGDSNQEIAVYANIFGTGLWFRDMNGNGAWDDGIDKLSLLGWGDDFAKPVVGDWNGDGRSKIGVYSNGLWLLDYDGDGVLSAADKIFPFGGWDGSVPLVGDWNGDGRESAGIYVPGHFVLDYNADHHFENGPEDRVYEFGASGANVVPVIGDWNGNGKKKIGIFRAGQWSLDLNGDGQASGAGESLFFFGPKGGTPVVGDWADIGKDSIGAVDDGAWYLDVNGDRIHNGLDPILFWGDEGENRIFIPGKWQSPED